MEDGTQKVSSFYYGVKTMKPCKTCEYATEDNKRVGFCMFPRCVKENGFIADKGGKVICHETNRETKEIR